MRARPDPTRAGVALPLALAVMVAVTVISVTAIQVARSDYQANRGARLSARALFAAEAGAQRTLARWESGPWTTLAPGDSASTGWVRLPDGARYVSLVVRVDNDTGTPLYSVRTEGRPSRTGTARRTVLTMVRAGEGGLLVSDAAARIRGRVNVDSDDEDVPTIDGRDHVPSFWSRICPAPGAAVAGAIVEESRDVRLRDDASLEGAPELREVGTMDFDITEDIGTTTWDELVAQADWQYNGNVRFRNEIEPSARSGTCDTSDPENWGAPENPGSVCADYAPTIYVRRNLRIDDGEQGQGILLIGGNLHVRGEFRFYGLVIVQGRLLLYDESSITGAVVVANGGNGTRTSQIRQESRIRFSSCAVARVSTGSGAADFLPGRWWFEIP